MTATVEGAARRPGRPPPAGRPRPAAGRPRDGGSDGTATWRVAPARTTTYVVRLPATATHALREGQLEWHRRGPIAVDVGADSHRRPGGVSVTIRGVVRASGGAPLPGQAVVLQVRGPERWRPVATATSDAFGGGRDPDPGGRADGGLPLARRTGDQRPMAVVLCRPCRRRSRPARRTPITFGPRSTVGDAGRPLAPGGRRPRPGVQATLDTAGTAGSRSARQRTRVRRPAARDRRPLRSADPRGPPTRPHGIVLDENHGPRRSRR